MIARHTLDNGVRVVVEQVPAVRSVAVGVWVDVGSRDEVAGVFGVSHFLEHLLFKGTDDLPAAEIARCFDAIGGEFNAFTSKEQTVFYVRTLDEDAGVGLDIIADITQHPAFRPDEIESERRVVLEEINMHDDAPDEVVHEIFAEALFDGHPLARRILGSRKSIADVARDAIVGYHHHNYTPGRMVISAAGNVDPDTFVADVSRRWGSMAAGAERAERNVALSAEPADEYVVERDSEQVNVIAGVRSLAQRDDRRHALSILNHIFGGGMSSRLFQKVREELGLVYSVYSFRSMFEDCGQFGVYVGCAPSRVEPTLEVVSSEFDRLREGVGEDEFEAARSHIRGALALSQEDTYSRMARIGRAEIALGEVPTMDELVARIDAVTIDEVNTLAADLATRTRTIAAIGPIDPQAIRS